MKIIITGSSKRYSITQSLCGGFLSLSHECVIFPDEDLYISTAPYFKNKITHRLFWPLFASVVNRKLKKKCEEEQPDLLFFIKGFYVSPHTISEIKKKNPRLIIFNYNPDNPFNTWAHGNSNSWIRNSIPLFDTYFIWGKFLIPELIRAGAKRVEYLPFAFDSHLHYPMSVSEEEKKYFGSDIAFIGTYDREREKWLSALCDYDLKIWGNSWEKANNKLQKKWQRKEMIGEDFSKICASAKIILNFIRKQNGNAHNMRTFEVPACIGFELSSRTEEQLLFFEENKEMAYFATKQELQEKIEYYISHANEREKIKEAGYIRSQDSTYSYLARAKKILEIYREIKHIV